MQQESMKEYRNSPERGVPPAADEIEISVFGPGYGESILIHASHDNWIIVDSCLNPSTKRPAPLEYLEELRINPALSVRQIIASHWHDDHSRGLAEIVEACDSATFICSDAMNNREFLTLVNTYSKHYLDFSTGINEFKKIIDILSERKVNPVFATANRRLWEIILNNGEEYKCCIQSLSPSDRAIVASRLNIRRLLPMEGEPKRCAIASNPNYAAVALWVSINDFNILLGSDLENTGYPNDGWAAIVNSDLRPRGRAKCFKIPHHGSSNAHSHDVWDQMVDREHVSILTPFVLGSTVLPKRDDVNRICSISADSYTAASIRSRRIRRDRSVERTIREMGIDISVTNPGFGQVRMRIGKNGAIEIKLFFGATSLNDIYN